MSHNQTKTLTFTNDELNLLYLTVALAIEEIKKRPTPDNKPRPMLTDMLKRIYEASK